MEIIDLIPDYLWFCRGEHQVDSYLGSSPRFFDHYFTYWGKNRTIDVSLSEQEIIRRSQMIRRHLTDAEENFGKFGLKLNDISALLFVGQGRANGHALIDGEKAIAWYALETLETDEQMKVFVAHELTHALQYSLDRESYFQTVAEKNSVSRQLITEGIATYLPMKLCGVTEEESLWADTLPQEELQKWMTACRNGESGLFRFTLDHFNSSDTRLFLAADPNDIYQFRAGYYVGLKVIEKIIAERSVTPFELMHTPMKELVELGRDALIDLEKKVANKTLPAI